MMNFYPNLEQKQNFKHGKNKVGKEFIKVLIKYTVYY